ncbi:DAK2 domain-containing protein [Corynebacterium sp. H78]|uniref:DAK2 domain-containing protein n=1 Tax=Corynebacterium sp. H78 TaxID=3133417 RepID=UPI0030B41A0F
MSTSIDDATNRQATPATGVSRVTEKGEGAGVPDVITADVMLRWLRRSVAVLDRRREEINQLNVFPVPDSDTGSNMVATLSSSVAVAEELAATAAEKGQVAAATDMAAALSSGAVRGARGNSGTVLSQVFRAVAESTTAEGVGADDIRRALKLAVRHVDAAIADPVEGTILTVLRQAAVAAAESESDELLTVVTEAAGAARVALANTPSQLPALRKAGVVDAGGAGLVLLLDALVDELTGKDSEDADLHVEQVKADGPEIEVMFLLEAEEEPLSELKRRLEKIGNSLIVAGEDEHTHMVHIHSQQPGLVLETAMDYGRPTKIHIEALVLDKDTPADPGRLVLAIAPTGPIADLFHSAGARIIAPSSPNTADDDAVDRIVSALNSVPAQSEILLLPNGLLSSREMVQIELAAQATEHAINILPTSTLANGIAAMAVHDSERPMAVDAYAMSEASAGMRTAMLHQATSAGLTAVGPCARGDVLASVNGDILVIADDVDKALNQTVDLMLKSGGELITVLLGTGVDPRCATSLRARLLEHTDDMDVVAYAADGMAELIQVGVE